MIIGIVGAPNAGKSTFFKAATLAEVAIAEYPFTTIKANHGAGYVKIDCVDKEFNVKCQPKHGFCLKNNRFVLIELMDVAGLVPGASEGKGLGNQFLDDLRQADAFIHIVDASGTIDAEGKPVENYDVAHNIWFLEDELNKWYFNIFMRVWKGFAKKAELEGNFSRAVAKQFSGLKVDENHVKKVLKKLNFSEKPTQWNEQQLMEFASELRRETKPMIIAANKIDMEKAKKNYQMLKKEFPELIIIPCSADSELALREAAKHELIDYIPGDGDFKILNEAKMNEKQKAALDKIKKQVLDGFETGTGIQEVLNKAVFELLKYIAVFPVDSANKLTDSKASILPDCFLLPKESTALDFAYHLHTDLGKNFIKAINAKSKIAVGKDYKLKSRDVLEIITR